MEPLPEFLQPLCEMIPPFPRETLEEAVSRREESTPHLLRAIEEAANTKEVGDDDWCALDALHIYALYLLAQFHETRAYEPIVRLLRNPIYEDLTGDGVLEQLPRILASVCGGDVGPIKALFEDREIPEYVRAAALESLGVLVNAGLLSREELSAYVGVFLNDRTDEKATGYLWDVGIYLCVEHRLTEHLAAIRALYHDGVADPQFETLEDVEKGMVLPPGESVYPGSYERPEGLIDSAIDELKDWWCFDPKSVDHSFEPIMYDDPSGPAEPYVRAQPKVGRNDPCPCGSGRKFKKCCGAAA